MRPPITAKLNTFCYKYSIGVFIKKPPRGVGLNCTHMKLPCAADVALNVYVALKADRTAI
ncbi:uncharacterized protein PHALS_12244 [Plasmopara halstedii]|uniref:Uncharacterized protein n=1 Tax=Plasmopara halstedii TaxID=4781 RepID=A0A0P1AKY6_PLAHL|nr:uncharacterized protein PHALS_12244 [Plasmopara halstedii]CEG41932.1 hypothetical protein PHALS_12244 [Plasmopara halstedii]|eukprot:XP_024578301.1 hypothetical protein PHALS_12244 [Plasmopara halstedii]